MTDVPADGVPGYPESWALSAVPPQRPAERWCQAARHYLGLALLVVVTVAAIYGLVVVLPSIASASAPGGCGGG